MKLSLFLTKVTFIVFVFSINLYGQEENELLGQWNELDGKGYIEFQYDNYGKFECLWDLCGLWSQEFKYKIKNSIVYIEPLEKVATCKNLYVLKYTINNDLLQFYKINNENENVKIQNKFIKNL